MAQFLLALESPEKVLEFTWDTVGVVCQFVVKLQPIIIGAFFI